MKKYLIVFACLLLAFASCKKDEDIPEPAPTPTPDPGVTCLAPTDLAVIVENYNNAVLTWSGTSESYKIYRNDVLITTGITDTTYTDPSLDLGDYTYKVKGVCSSTESDFSEEVTITIVNPFVGEYVGTATVDGNVTVLQQTIPYTNTVDSVLMSVKQSVNYDKVDVDIVYKGQTLTFVGTIVDNTITLPNQQFDNLVIPISYMGTSFNVNVNMTLSDLSGTIDNDGVITGSALAAGKSTIEIPLIGATDADLNFPISIVFNKIQ